MKIKSLTCTKFSWEEPTLSAGFSVTLSGTIFENQELRDEMPITIDGTLEVSKTTMSMGVNFHTKTADGGFGMIATAEKISLWFEGSFELPRVDNEVRWEFFPEAQTIYGAEQVEDLKALLKKNNIKLTLKAPPEAEVSGLPSGYTQDGSTYAWFGTQAADALATQATGTVSPDITYTYVYVPPPTILSSPPPEVVEEQKLTISGIAQPNSTVKVYSNGVVKRTTTAGSDGSFSVDVMLDEGFNSIRVSTTDAAGNESPRVAYGATVYTPAAAAAAPAPMPWLLIGAVVTIIVAAVVELLSPYAGAERESNFRVLPDLLTTMIQSTSSAIEVQASKSSSVARRVSTLPSSSTTLITSLPRALVTTLMPLGASKLSGRSASAIALEISSLSYAQTTLARICMKIT